MKTKPRSSRAVQTLSVLIFQEGDWLSAQCLEYDVATQAKTLEDLWYELQRIIVGHIATSRKTGREPFAGVPRAPQKYWDVFDRSKISLPPPRPAFNLQRKVRIVPKRVRVATAA